MSKISDLGVIDSVPSALLAISLGRQMLAQEKKGTDRELSRSVGDVPVVDDDVIRGILWWGVEKGYLETDTPISSGEKCHLYLNFEDELNDCIDLLDNLDWTSFYQQEGAMVSDDNGDLHVDLKCFTGKWTGSNLQDLYPSWVALEFLAQFYLMEGSECTEVYLDVSQSVFEGVKDPLILIKKFELWNKPTGLNFHLKHPSSLVALEKMGLDGGAVNKTKLMEKEIALLHAENTFYYDLPMEGKSAAAFPWKEGDVLCMYDIDNSSSNLVVVRQVGHRGVYFDLYVIRTAGEGYTSLALIPDTERYNFHSLKNMRVEKRGCFLQYTDLAIGHVLTQYDNYLLSGISCKDISPVRLSDGELRRLEQLDVLSGEGFEGFTVETEWGALTGFEVWMTERDAVRVLLTLAGADFNEESLTTVTSPLGA